MPIYLPGEIYFTDQDDVAPMSWDMPQAITNWNVTYTLAGNDLITGTSLYFDYGSNGGTGFLNKEAATINTGNGRDVITGYGLNYGSDGSYRGYGIDNRGSIETGDDGDNLTSYGTFYNSGIVSLGDGDDELNANVPERLINSYWALWNDGTIDAGNGDDFLSVSGSFGNNGTVSLGPGNDSILSNAYLGNNIRQGLQNYQTIETGDGDDKIITNGMYNQGFINTGNGKDSLIARNFEGSGSVFLGNGEDFLCGFGNGYYEGGNDQDSLELTSGDYTIGISGGIISFTKSGYTQTMQTSGFEKLIGGRTTYDFTNLSDGMIIYVP